MSQNSATIDVRIFQYRQDIESIERECERLQVQTAFSEADRMALSMIRRRLSNEFDDIMQVGQQANANQVGELLELRRRVDEARRCFEALQARS